MRSLGLQFAPGDYTNETLYATLAHILYHEHDAYSGYVARPNSWAVRLIHAAWLHTEEGVRDGIQRRA